MYATDDFDSYGRTQAEIDAILAHTVYPHHVDRIDEAARLLAARERVRRRYGEAPAARVVAGLGLDLSAAGADAPPPPRPEPAPSTPRRESLPAPVSDLEAGARLMDAELARIISQIVARIRRWLAAALRVRITHRSWEGPQIG